jgi:hypothetical protein
LGGRTTSKSFWNAAYEVFFYLSVSRETKKNYKKKEKPLSNIFSHTIEEQNFNISERSDFSFNFDLKKFSCYSSSLLLCCYTQKKALVALTIFIRLCLRLPLPFYYFSTILFFFSFTQWNIYSNRRRREKKHEKNCKTFFFILLYSIVISFLLCSLTRYLFRLVHFSTDLIRLRDIMWDEKSINCCV